MPHPEAATEAVGMLADTAYAKINLALHVRARRADGYHALESLFAFAEDGDGLTARAGDAISLTIGGPFGGGLDAGADNLVVRAAMALRDHLGERRGATLHLDKRLPVASGIGGGSADAAAALRLLVRLWDARIDDAALADIALGIGSDVPACLASQTQLVKGRGDVLARHDVAGLAGAPLLLVNPGAALSTARVFAGWDGIDRGALDAASLETLIADGRNDLQAPAITLAPVIADVIAALRACAGVTLARMSGSGATCFALFDSGEARDAAATALGAAHPSWWTMASRIRAA